MIDAVAALRQLLLDDAALSALVGGRVYGVPSTQPPPAKNPPDPYVSLMATGGAYDQMNPTLTARATLRCYGPDQVQVMAVYQAVRAALSDALGRWKGPRLAGGRWLVRYCELGGPAMAVEPEGWLVCISTLTARLDSAIGS